MIEVVFFYTRDTAILDEELATCVVSTRIENLNKTND